MELLAGLEQIAAVRLLKASFFAYPLTSALHIASVGVLLTSVVLLDLRILGLLRAMPEAAFVAMFRRLALWAFTCAAATGLVMFSVRAADYATMPVFLAKMALIALAALNFAVFVVLERRGIADLRIPAVVSGIAWPAALLLGRFVGFA